MDEEKIKKVDESWKAAVDKERIKESQTQDEKPSIPTPDFKFFISTLSLQALIALGELENPATQKKEEDANQAKFIIDTLDMLKDKTRGNLDEEELNLLDNILYELKMKYVAKGG